MAGSAARYYPFGDWRTEPTAGLTDMGYTGHRHNNLGSAPDDIGLIYMNARWYLPGLARFISADTLVPDPTNPQSFNRYSYVYDSPINLTDPTGHYADEGGATGGGCLDTGYASMCNSAGLASAAAGSPDVVPAVIPDAVGINISGSGAGGAAHFNMGIEWIYNFKSHEFTTFVVPGAGGTIFPSGGGSVNVSLVGIYNLGEENYNYRGSFNDVNITASGVTAGHAWVPNDYDKGPRSYYAGISLGAEISGSISRAEYIPTQTIDFDTLTIEYPIVPYTQELFLQRMFGVE